MKVKIYSLWSSSLTRVLLFILLVVYISIESRGRNDFDIFIEASKNLLSGADIYSTTYFDGYHYYYSLLFSTIVIPLIYVGPVLSKVIWMIVSIAAIARILQIISLKLVKTFSERDRIFFFFLLIIFMLRFLRGNLHTGQITIIILWMSLEGIFLILDNKKITGGLLLAFAINIKLLPLVFLPYLFYRNELKAGITTIACLAIFYLLPMLWLPHGYYNELMTSWWHLVNPADQRHVLDIDETSFHSLTTLAAVYLTDTNELHGLRSARNFLALSAGQVFIVITCVRIIVVLFTLWFLRTLPFRRSGNNEKTWWEISYLFLAIPLIFPHQQHYAFLMTMPAVAYMIYWLMTYNAPNAKLRVWISVTVMIYLCFNLALILGVFTAWYNHYKILTFGALLLAGTLAAMRPGKGQDFFEQTVSHR